MSRRGLFLLALASSLGLSFVACFEPDVPSDYLPPGGADETPVDLFPPEDAGTPDTGSPDACSNEDPDPAASLLRFRVRTSKVGGKFAPRNVGAIWLQDGDGAFVRTLERWGVTRAKWLVTFNEASGGDVVDAITGPTKLAHEVHEVTWDLTDLSGCPVAPGAYSIWLELTDRSGAGVTLEIPFTLPAGGQPVTVEETDTFHDMTITWE